MKYKKIYLTAGYDNRYIIKYRDCKKEELTSFENRQNKKYLWVRMWNKELAGWYTIQEKYLKKIPSTDIIYSKSTSEWQIHHDLVIENEYIIKQMRKEKIIKLNEFKLNKTKKI